MGDPVEVEHIPRTQRDIEDEKEQIEINTSTGDIHLATSNLQKSTGVLSKTLSRIRTPDIADPGPPPDGGFKAWSVAFATHLVIFNTWGFINSFGVFQTYYVEVMRIGDPSSVAWIGTTQVFVLFGMGTFTGRALDAGFFNIQYICGSVIYVVGLFLLSLCREYWQIFLAQTVCVGFGYGLAFVPTLALASTYFEHKRATALGMAVTGSAIGGLVFPAIAEKMLPTAGFPWTIRTMAFVQLLLAGVAFMFLKPRLPPRKSGPVVEWSALREAPYTLYLMASFLYFWSVYVGFFFIGTFGRDALGTSQATSINLLMVLNGVGVPSRVVPAYIAQRWVGPLNLMIPMVGVAGIILYCWIAVDSVTGLWIFAVVYGVVAAGIQALFPVVLTSLTRDPKKAGVRTGMGFSIAGLAVLTGSPIAGALIQSDGGKFIGLQVFAATSMMSAAMVLLCVRWVTVGWKRVRV
ncbi:uncharacterized protein PV07_08279 [Cladophialophora immunda]|uniref:Major facilitator superfamily (MFS) profile domain-containing protein n=1 Tax=Cladophialophora immunda TaxID=569365 RepID=A0A0D2CEF0_9EURO|nr:uncharacterized protein PV07_08279 [Cladophialophora immunda]KIW28635.1 hypothetical protein PV07_08279 [Cladophialophora immunda]